MLWIGLTAPVVSVGALLGGLCWAIAPGLATAALWRWSSTPGTRLYRAPGAEALLRAARHACGAALAAGATRGSALGTDGAPGRPQPCRRRRWNVDPAYGKPCAASNPPVHGS
ncbi:MAG: hypothetical protein R3F59_36050 [Myxococcota bacterium]